MRARPSVLAIALLASLAASARAAGPTADDCISADTKAQSLRRDGKLRAAREQLAICGSPSCPAMVRDDCVQRVDELERVTPTIVFDVKDAQGHDVSNVTVSMDGAPLAQKLTGTALPVDLGDHEFAFTAPGYLKHVQHFVLSEGQKGRHEVIRLVPPDTTTPETKTPETTTPETTTPVTTHEAPPPAAPEEAKPSGSPLRAVGITVAAVGLVGIGVGAAFGFDAMSKRDAANCPQNVCADSTSASTLVDAKQSANISTVLFIVGGVLAGGGTLMWLLAPSHKVKVEPTVGFGSVGLTLRGAW